MVRDGYFPDPHPRQPSSSRDVVTQQSDEDESDERVQKQRAMDEYRDGDIMSNRSNTCE